MNGRLLLLCPGQGGQHAGMFDLARSHAGARDFLAACALPDDPQALFDNRVAQPAIVAATLAMWIALRESLGPVALVAGYSIGELAAYGVAGALSPVDTVRMASARAALMDDAAAGVEQGLAAVSGVDVNAVRACIDVAIVTGHDSCIAGGTRAQLDALPAQLPFARIQALPVGVASHTALMEDAVAPFTHLLDNAAFGQQRVPVLAGTDAMRVLRREDAIDRLARNLYQTIEWAACMDAIDEAGITVALELGPGSALARMLANRHQHIACRSVADFHTLDGVVKWVARQMDQA
jgi:[acyl-carrier-protein] S-malonyltransferase